MYAAMPGVRTPRFTELAEAGLSSQVEVVGVSVNGVCRAYPVPLLSIVDSHIVNDLIDGTPVSVTYCDLADQVRVLTSKKHGDRIPLSVGGLDENHQLLFLFGDERYRQQSKKLPLDDYPFLRVTLGEWSSLHPDTLVYVSPFAGATDLEERWRNQNSLKLP